MIIDEIKLTNVGIYLGEQCIILTPPNSKKPITLIGGDNGAGKTTLLDALQLGLYGKLTVSNERNGLGYNKYLESMINRNAKPGEGTSIQISFRSIEDGYEKIYLITRKWSASKGKVKEHFDVYVDNEKDDVLADTWYEQVERFIPARLRHIYFFNGERVEAFADIEQTATILSTAVQALLGIDLVEQLRIDLKVISQRKSKEVKSEKELEKIDELERTLKETNKERRELISDITRLEQKLSGAKKDFKQADDLFAEKGGHLFEQHHYLENQKIEVTTNLANIQIELINLTSGSLPLMIVRDYLINILDQAHTEEQNAHDEITEDLIKKRDKRLRYWLKKQGVEDDLLQVLNSFFEKEKKTQLKEKTIRYLDFNKQNIRQLDSLVSGGLLKEWATAEKLLSQSSELSKKLDDIDGKLARVPDEEAIQRIISKRDKSIKKISDLENEFNTLKTQLESKNRVREQLVKQLDDLLRTQKSSEFENQQIHRFQEHTEMVSDILSSFQNSILKGNLENLEEIILEGYRHLLHKKSLLGRIQIDAKSFRMTIYNHRGEVIPSNKLSAGERQLLAVSILWGLGKASGRPLPICIDTPLSKLDSTHRSFLVKKYFPKASHQVILLSTDEEIDQKYYEMLKRSIGHTYRIDYNEKTESSTIEKGYFW